MSGTGSGGGGRDDDRPARPIKQTGSDGGSDDDPCAIVQTAPINSPKPAVISGLSVGDVLTVVLTGTAPRQILELHTPAGGVAGSLTHRGHLTLINCIGAGNVYQAEVIQKTGGAVVVRVERT